MRDPAQAAFREGFCLNFSRRVKDLRGSDPMEAALSSAGRGRRKKNTGSLHSAPDDDAVRCSGRDDGFPFLAPFHPRTAASVEMTLQRAEAFLVERMSSRGPRLRAFADQEAGEAGFGVY